jgi:FlaA1/EpsC-like NDP-sugar epimerase
LFPRNRYFLILDLIALPFLALVSFLLRLESIEAPVHISGLLVFVIVTLIVKLSAFAAGGLYQRYWRTAGPTDLLMIWQICALFTAPLFLLWLVMPGQLLGLSFSVPRSIPLIDSALTVIYLSVSRFSLRAFDYWRLSRRTRTRGQRLPGDRLLVIGAGKTGIQVLEALANTNSAMRVMGFLDDDLLKVGHYVREVKVLGQLRDLDRIVVEDKIDLVIIAIPSAPGSVIRQVVETCRSLKVEHRIVPGTAELATGKVTVNALRPIQIEDLLRRRPVALDVDHIRAQMEDKCVLVTGAGGSIGGELVRQIAGMGPARLILVGRGENSLFLVENHLRRFFPAVRFETHLVDIRYRERLQAVFEKVQPDIVFHAAAHKHVPMLETNVLAAIANNVMGTQNVIELCNRFKIERMVLLSTDKAVEPNSVMGMTKRVAELLLLHASLQNPGRFAAVRFGNVLGSRGSVVPTFRQQIENGGPVTVTSDKMTRFFMSIPEAAQLVLKAAALKEAGPLFVLNMGEPVRIVDLAYELILLSGFEPGRDIEVKVTGTRPGEKMHEALFWDFEARQSIENGAIFALRLSAEHLNTIRDAFPECLAALTAAVEQSRPDEAALRATLRGAAYVIPGTAVISVPELTLGSQPVAHGTNGKVTAAPNGVA